MKAPAKDTSTEKALAEALPYSQQIDDNTVITYEGDLTQTLRLQGIPFETIGHVELNGRTQTWRANLNAIGRTSGVALWTHIVRKAVRYDQSRIEYDNSLSTEFARQYSANYDKETLYVNDLYVSPVVRLGATSIDRWGVKLSKADSQGMRDVREQAHEKLRQVSNKLLADLRPYHPTLLGTYQQEDRFCSEQARFYAQLMSTAERHIPLARAELSYQLQVADVHFGYETIEIDGAAGSRYAAVLGLVAPYTATNTNARMFDGLLSAKFEFVLSQSVTYMPRDQAEKMLKAQRNLIMSTSNNQEQLREVDAALAHLQNGKFYMLDHEWLLVIYGNSIAELNSKVNEAVALLDRKVLGSARIKGGALVNAYFNTLPGNFKFSRSRSMPISSENFANFFPMHNYSVGNAQGSQWGMPIALLKTDGESPYFFNYHVSRNALDEQGVQLEYDDAEEGEETEHRKEVGNYKIIGRTGLGKTVIKLALRLLARKRWGTPLRTFSFDYLRGEEICIRAMRGRYFRFEAEQYTRTNPFRGLEPSPENISFIARLLSWAAEQGDKYKMTPDDENELVASVRAVFRLDERVRRVARVRDNLTAHSGLWTSLGRWCEDGAYAWVLDSEEDDFNLAEANDYGFDMTSLLEVDQARTPVLMYLTHRISHEAGGRPHIIDIAEAWRALADPQLQGFMKSMAKAVRRKQGLIGLDTQEPADLTKSALGSTLLSQFPNEIILPDSRAHESDYIDGLHLTPREFSIIKNTPEGQGYFLNKKGKESSLVRLDLSGMNDMLAIISSSEENTDLVDGLIQAHGVDPDKWLPHFLKRRQ